MQCFQHIWLSSFHLRICHWFDTAVSLPKQPQSSYLDEVLISSFKRSISRVYGKSSSPRSSYRLFSGISTTVSSLPTRARAFALSARAFLLWASLLPLLYSSKRKRGGRGGDSLKEMKASPTIGRWLLADNIGGGRAGMGSSVRFWGCGRNNLSEAEHLCGTVRNAELSSRPLVLLCGTAWDKLPKVKGNELVNPS